MFDIKQLTSVWFIPFVAVTLCFIFWVFHTICCKSSASKTSFADGFIASTMVLFYTLFPSVLNRIALSLSCRKYGDRSILTQALSVQCWKPKHLSIVYSVGIPGMFFYALLMPLSIASLLFFERRQGRLYPAQENYNSKWTLRFGFMFASYRQGYEWWETVIMLRKVGFIFLSIFLRPYGPAAQIVAAGMILVLALSAHLHYRPYYDEGHNVLESIGLHACIFQILTALLCNELSTSTESTGSQSMRGAVLGPRSTVIMVCMTFSSTFFFFFIVIRYTVLYSQHTDGIIGILSRKSLTCCCLRRAYKKLKALPPPSTNKSSNKVVPTHSAGRLARMLTISNGDAFNKLIINEQVIRFEKLHDEDHAKSLNRIRNRKIAADQRMRMRLRQRRTLAAVVCKYKTEVNAIKDMIRTIVPNLEKLQDIIDKLDKEHSHKLNRDEFDTLIIQILLRMGKKQGGKQEEPSAALMKAVWTAAWQMRKHHNEQEIDCETLGAWLDLQHIDDDVAVKVPLVDSKEINDNDKI